jgi:hypothetical protein
MLPVRIGLPVYDDALIFFASNSRNIFGLALPPDACITWPIRKPMALMLLFSGL